MYQVTSEQSLQLSKIRHDITSLSIVFRLTVREVAWVIEIEIFVWNYF